MEYKTIIVKEDKISEIMLNRPEKRNAMSFELMNELLYAFDDLNKKQDVNVIILKGKGKGFCSGADLNIMNSKEVSIERKTEYTSMLPKLIKGIMLSNKLVIAQVHGFAIAGGFGLAMSADLVVCADNAKLGMPEIKNGLMPMNIMAPVSKVVPKKKLFEMMFTGELITSQEALAYGIVNKVVDEMNLENETFNLAEKISSYSRELIKLGKEAYYTIQDMEFEKCFNYLNDMLMKSIISDKY